MGGGGHHNGQPVNHSGIYTVFAQILVWQRFNNFPSTLWQRSSNFPELRWSNVIWQRFDNFRSMLWQLSCNFPGLRLRWSNVIWQRFHSFRSMLWKRCCSIILLARRYLICIGNIPNSHLKTNPKTLLVIAILTARSSICCAKMFSLLVGLVFLPPRNRVREPVSFNQRFHNLSIS